MKNKGFAINIKFLTAALILSLIALPLIAMGSHVAFADSADIAEKRYCTATADDEFADDKIVLVMNDNADNIVTYTLSYFTEAEFTEIEDLTQDLKDMMRSGDRQAEESGIFKRENFRSILRLTLKNKGKRHVLDVIHTLEKRADILSAEPDYTMQLNGSANDKYYSSGDLWALNGRNGIHAKEAWDITTGSNIRVGVIDSGIDANHPDLMNRVNVDVSRSYYEVNDSGPTVDEAGHGTMVAGIIGAEGDNGIGVVGVSRKVELVALKVNTESVETYCTQLVNAISHAIANRIWILNSSIGFTSCSASNVSALEAILRSYDGLLVVSAGNENQEIDGNSNFFPSCVESSNLMVVGALDRYGKRWIGDVSNKGSNYGSEVDIYAPGSEIICTYPIANCFEGCATDEGRVKNHHVGERENLGYHCASGTSMAAPHVTGVAALITAANPALRGWKIKDIILNNADSITITTPDNVTQKVKKLNAYKAVLAAHESVYKTKDISFDTVEIVGAERYVPKKLYIPSSIDGKTVVSIGLNAFNNTYSVEEVTFASDSKITTIGIQAFSNCLDLKSVTIPASVTRIEIGAFMGCTQLRYVSFKTNSALTYIGAEAFGRGTILTEIRLPKSLTEISYGAFGGCSKLNKVIFENTDRAVRIGSGCFDSTPSDLKLYVPENLYNDYVASAQGTSYVDKFVKIQ